MNEEFLLEREKQRMFLWSDVYTYYISEGYSPANAKSEADIAVTQFNATFVQETEE